MSFRVPFVCRAAAGSKGLAPQRGGRRRRLAGLAAAALLLGGGAGVAPVQVLAQQAQPEWFVPGGQQRPGQGAATPQQRAPQQRPAQQRPAQARVDAPAPLPPGQSPPAPVIGLVNVPEVLRVSIAHTQVREEIERRRAKLNEDLQREQQRWREEQQRLGAERAALSPEQLRARERELQDRVTDAQRIFRDRQRAIEEAAQQALAEVEQALVVVITQVAESRHVNLVLPAPVVIYNQPQFDLTAEVAAQLNQRLRSVDIPPEETGEAASSGQAQPQQRPAAQQRPAQQPRRN
ncbi:OmpH family outer membrane protein [Caldovatus aquaticus]|uniref:OmpH family outer membrane protein n=1 Tax=Caldovatus aquaticus TaxID=2865671 RepID=A0ABS7F3E4_9PROT|nr:OmpH family outer membrane protein [Caldovatus aquaticus]MBW8269320.1 OmpH family outer membrane protein [Caldovatus aquaticus]